MNKNPALFKISVIGVLTALLFSLQGIAQNTVTIRSHEILPAPGSSPLNLTVRWSIHLVSGTGPVTIGANTKLIMNFNNVAGVFNTAGAIKTSPSNSSTSGYLMDGVAPYRPLTFDKSNPGQISVTINANSTGTPATLNNAGDSLLVVEFTLPILSCSTYIADTWDDFDGVVNDWSGVNLGTDGVTVLTWEVTPQGGITPRPTLRYKDTITATPINTTVPHQKNWFCREEGVKFNVVSGGNSNGYTNYHYYYTQYPTPPQAGQTPNWLDGPNGTGSSSPVFVCSAIGIPFPLGCGVPNKSYIGCKVTNSDCTYDVITPFRINIDTTAPAPAKLLPAITDTVSLVLSRCSQPPPLNPRPDTVSVQPNLGGGTTGYNWTVTDENGVSLADRIVFANPTDSLSHNKAIIYWNTSAGNLPIGRGGYARAFIRVSVKNSCGISTKSTSFLVHIYPNVPGLPPAPRTLNPNVFFPVCSITDTSIGNNPISPLASTRFRWTVGNKGDTTLYHVRYLWSVPDSAVRIPPPLVPLPVGNAPGDTSQAALRAYRAAAYKIRGGDSTAIYWNRNYQFDTITLQVRSKNGCGYGPYSSVKVKFNRLPGKPGKPIKTSHPGDDTLCGGTTQYPDTAITFKVPTPVIGGDIHPDSSYYWFVTPLPAGTGYPNSYYPPIASFTSARIKTAIPVGSTAGIYKIPATAGPAATAATYMMLGTKDSIKIRLGKGFYGWFIVQVAARSKYCANGLPYYANPSLPDHPTGYPALSVPANARVAGGLGPLSDPYRMYVRPTPLKCAKPKGPTSYYKRSFPTPTVTAAPYVTNHFRTAGLVPIGNGQTVISGRYATKFEWMLFDNQNRKVDTSLYKFLPDPFATASDSGGRSAQLKLYPAIPLGFYYVKVVGINACGFGDTSAGRRILVTDTFPSHITPIRANPVRIHTGPDTLALCSNPGCIRYRTSVRHAIEFIWRIRKVGPPDTGLTTTPDQWITPDTSGGNSEADLSDSSIYVCWDKNASGSYWVINRPINAGSRLTGSQIDTILSADSVLINIFPRPLAFIGVAQDLTTRTVNIPVGATFVMGGSPGVNTPLSYIGRRPGLGTPRYLIPPTGDGVGVLSYTWIANNPADTDLIFRGVPVGQHHSVVNPVFKANSAGTYTYRLKVTDANLCTSQATDTIITFTAYDTYNIKVDRLWLQQLYNISGGGGMATYILGLNGGFGPLTQATEVFSRISWADSNSYTEPARTLAFYASNRNKMMAGYRVSDGNPADLVSFELRKTTDTTAVPPVGTGFAWLQSNGHVVDFENANSYTVRLNSNPNNPIDTTASYYVVAKHRNHLSLMSKMKVKPQKNLTFPAAQAGAANGVVDFSKKDSLYLENQAFYNNSPAKYRGAAVFAPGFGIAAGQAAMPSGDLVREGKMEVNGSDYQTLMDSYVLTQHQRPLTNVYDNRDINLDGKFDLDDVKQLDGLLNSMYFSTVPYSQP